MITEKDNVFYCDCGFTFERGRSSAHDCGTGLRKKLAESQREFRAADATIENLQMKLEKMAAEYTWLKSKGRELLGEACAVYEKLNKLIDPAIGDFIDGQTLHEFQVVLNCETPATDAFLAEVRTSTITDALKSLDVVFDTDCVMESNGISYEDAEQRTAGAYAVSKALEDFAAQLRKGVQS